MAAAFGIGGCRVAKALGVRFTLEDICHSVAQARMLHVLHIHTLISSISKSCYCWSAANQQITLFPVGIQPLNRLLFKVNRRWDWTGGQCHGRPTWECLSKEYIDWASISAPIAYSYVLCSEWGQYNVKVFLRRVAHDVTDIPSKNLCKLYQ